MAAIGYEWLRQAGWFAGTVGGAVGCALLTNYVLLRIIGRATHFSEVLPDGVFNKHCRRAFRWLLITIAVYAVVWSYTRPAEHPWQFDAAQQVLALALIACVSWVVVKLFSVLEETVLSRFRVDVADNLRARKIQTQLRVLKRIVTVVVVILAAGMMLMMFEQVRQLGTTILASAGIVGIVVGMAAQRTIGTFIAGIQIAITQPIRIDDVVIVEGEWGRIEEITLTYVVVRIWDLRRLVVPIMYFIERPFQNWTRVSAELLGTVYLYLDYRVPFEDVRAELRRILEAEELWDKKVCVLQVTNATDKTIELRALMSASDASRLWTLRCAVREKLLAFIQQKFPQALPRMRAELDRDVDGRQTDERTHDK